MNSPKRHLHIGSGVHSRAVVSGTRRHSRFVPKGDLSRCSKLSGIRKLARKLLQTSLRRAVRSFFRLVFRFQSAEVFLNHTQMDPEPVQVDFECACNLERAYG